jgi:hypothetical protein
MEAEISLSYKTAIEAEAISKAVSPDNIKVPKGLSVRTEHRGRKVVTRIKCRTGILTLISTIDDLLSAVSVAERSISSLKSK